MRGKFWVIALIVSALAFIFYWNDRTCRYGCDNIHVSGNIEVTEVRLSFRIPGRVTQIFVNEGDKVSQGELVAQLDPEELHREVALRKAESSVAESVLKELESGFLPEEIAQAKAKLDQAEADFDRLQTDFERQQQLLNKEVISKREFDVSQAAYEVANSRLQEARKALTLMVKGARPEKIEQSQARVQQSQEALSLAETRLAYAELLSPLTGSVLSRSVEPGEYILPGATVVAVADLNDIWFRAYISESDLGRVKLGDAIKVTTDSYPGKVYQGRVTFIASEAEFTPKNIQTAEERVKLVYRIKVSLDNPNQELKPGMPADGHILINGRGVGNPSR
jgi:HlyD family secretion protein